MENTRSFARDFSSSRRAPPNARSNPWRSSACLSPSVFHMSVCSADPWSNGLIPEPNALGVLVDDQLEPELGRHPVAELVHLPELPGGVDVEQRERRLRRIEGLHAPGAASPSCPCRSSRASPAARSPTTASRMMWMLSASRRCRWVSVFTGAPGRASMTAAASSGRQAARSDSYRRAGCRAAGSHRGDTRAGQRPRPPLRHGGIPLVLPNGMSVDVGLAPHHRHRHQPVAQMVGEQLGMLGWPDRLVVGLRRDRAPWLPDSSQRSRRARGQPPPKDCRRGGFEATSA